MADFVEHTKMDELTNKIEEERTDAADTRTRLADEGHAVWDSLPYSIKLF